MTHHKQLIGKTGERLAAQYLETLGWKILAQNVTYRGAELDIIALEDDVVVFVEVRTRTTDTKGSALESITPAKLASLRKGIVQWLIGQETYHKARLDAVTVKLCNGQAELTLHRNIG
ncbi:YraN family protein [Gleimia sp. 6138-11-ORH1]|uniref:YraN family protein n=1 Tax=Gleimia sp. 6138-11-ORH1 TaxID=2973937 RepID=UPI0021677A54|nr:YraN family protein [Gleimia sp. 6138-11-ORH1]MCS4484892.1 YraN family protein [Gleimia sp. 6138-11-ORH1]